MSGVSVGEVKLTLLSIPVLGIKTWGGGGGSTSNAA